MHENMLSFSFLIAALSQILLVLSLLANRLYKTPIYLPLALFFLSSGLSFTFPAINILWPEVSLFTIFIVLPCVAIQPVALWLYVVGLTSPTKWKLSLAYWKHFLPIAFGILFSVVLLCTPIPLIESIFIEGKDPENTLGVFIVVSFLILMLVYLIQTSCYLIAIVKRLIQYQKQLKLLFSSNENRELIWVLAIVIILSGTWLATLIYFLPTTIGKTALFGEEVITGCYFVLIWVLSVWGLRQKPGFHGRYLSKENDELIDSINELAETKQKKYQRSALDSTQSERIAKKLELSMKEEELFLQADLSLPNLAEHIKVPANYLSQTLNENLTESFFDYINRWRIEYAKVLLIEGKETVLDIAMNSGFNAKSSFYKAFKKNTGQTPGQYMKSQ